MGEVRADRAGRLRTRYQRWDDFVQRRAQLDPNGVAMTDYWCERLGAP